MRKPEFLPVQKQGADQLHNYCEADHCLCFPFTDSTIPLLSRENFKPLAIFCACTAQLVLDLVGNPKTRFSHVAAPFNAG